MLRNRRLEQNNKNDIIKKIATCPIKYETLKKTVHVIGHIFQLILFKYVI